MKLNVLFYIFVVIDDVLFEKIQNKLNNNFFYTAYEFLIYLCKEINILYNKNNKLITSNIYDSYINEYIPFVKEEIKKFVLYKKSIII